MPRAHQACYPFRVGKLAPVSAGVERSATLIQPYGFDKRRIISVRILNFNLTNFNCYRQFMTKVIIYLFDRM